MSTEGGRLPIPLLYAIDAIHGNANVLGATVFPHNIGLGAANDPDLIERLARLCAEEVLASGLDWTFAPTLAVVRDIRWGRTYESFSEDPDLVASYAGRYVRGLQGALDGVYVINPGFVETPLTAQNEFKMPGLMTPEAAAAEIVHGLERGQFEIHFPRRFTSWLKMLRQLPYAAYFPAVRKFTGL